VREEEAAEVEVRIVDATRNRDFRHARRTRRRRRNVRHMLDGIVVEGVVALPADSIAVAIDAGRATEGPGHEAVEVVNPAGLLDQGNSPPLTTEGIRREHAPTGNPQIEGAIGLIPPEVRCQIDLVSPTGELSIGRI